MAIAESVGSGQIMAPRSMARPGGDLPSPTYASVHRVVVCLLGGFRVLKDGRPLTLRAGGSTQVLLGSLALRTHEGIDRETLLTLVWPASEAQLAGQALNSVVYALRRSLGDAVAGGQPVLHRGGRYWLNTEGGVAVDVDAFERTVEIGDRLNRAGNVEGAIRSYEMAVDMYSGDLSMTTEVRHVLDRERLRATFLSLGARLAEHHFDAGDYRLALDKALAVLGHDPCREDAHRIAMRCYVRIGERAQALRQYATCCRILELEFGVGPEGLTEALYQRIRTQPDRV